MTARPIMVQGTMSGVGKSLLVAGLCRVFRQDGLSVAPFKAQNMALNSGVTADGAEIGRAQVLQAAAAGIEPEPAMNPILLKPTTDTGSQVIVGGRVLATMSARDYYAYKAALAPVVRRSYEELASRFDVVAIEGAGSPAEVNLKRDDFVNMGMAKIARSPVLLAGDIDRGGVFAQILGTLMLLDPDERALVKGTVVNKFRGDKTILDPGLDVLRERSGVPVVGVVPYARVDLDDEDSLSERLDVRDRTQALDVAVLRLPRISNFTDLLPLSQVPGVGVRYVSRPGELGEPDLIVVPGTKATLADLRWVRESGLEALVVRRAGAGTPVLGICGGYQMLGEEVADPLGAEGGGTLRGMGLLPVRTTFVPEKCQVRSSGRIARVEGPLAPLSGRAVSGYQIHLGRTEALGGSPLCLLSDGDGGEAEDGCQAGCVYGTYLHGLLDSGEVASALVEALLARRGLDASDVRAIDLDAYRERQLDLLADLLRENLDMGLVYEILERGV